MSGYQSPAHRYREVAVKTASPLQLIVMLYDAAICCTREAQQQLANKDIAGRSKSVNKCITIITELQSCLNLQAGGEIASSLNRLYDYMKRRIFKANVDQSREPLLEVEGLLDNLRSAWVELVNQPPSAQAPAVGQPVQNRNFAGPADHAPNQPRPFSVSA
jgi:flagellar secretion chaperone FliS